MSSGQSGLFDQPAPEPLRRRGVIHIGTSGYVFPDWRGVFYPERLPQRRWLEFYAAEFSSVEINATYYRIPPRSTFESMAERTPDHYPFWVKLPGEVTHGTAEVEPIMTQFFDALEPLHTAEKLAGVLAQFPQSFRPGEAALEKVGRLRELCRSAPLAVEFRRRDWQTAATYEFLRREHIIVVIPDLPRLSGLPEAEIQVTADVAYVRFHGRNSKTWHDPSQGDRYDYEYSLDQLRNWRPKIRALEEVVAGTFIFFNNCHMGQAVKNAMMLRELLSADDGSLL